MKIHYWMNVTDSIYVEFDGEYNPSIEIKDGDVTFAFDGEYYGPNIYSHNILFYDLCALVALYQEVKEDRE